MNLIINDLIKVIMLVMVIIIVVILIMVKEKVKLIYTLLNLVNLFVPKINILIVESFRNQSITNFIYR